METINVSPVIVTDEKSVSLPLLSYELPALIEKLKLSRSWAKGELKNMILLNGPKKQVLLTALHERTEIDSCQANESVSYDILQGKLLFRTLKESLILSEGQMVTLHEKVFYSLTAIEETVFLLTISK